MEHALSDLHVVEFAAYAAGPVVGKTLANHGATVVHVESASRPDGFRLQYPPFKDNQPGLNRAGLFALCNDSKLDVTVNLKHPKARTVKEALVRWADVIIENYTPGTMERLGLGYEAVRALNPRAIMLSSTNLGQRGPNARHPGFGSQLTSYAGFTNLTGYPETPPAILYGPYIDYIAVGMGLIAVLAALDRRLDTGEGQYIDLSQLAAGVHFLAAPLLDAQVNGRVAQRQGNGHPSATPHGVFPCAGTDRWCTIAVYCDDEWEGLKRAMGRPAWLQEHPEWDSVAERRRAQAEIAEGIAAWTRAQRAEEVVALLEECGVPSAAVEPVDHVYSDPQLKSRTFWTAMDHPTLGRFHYQGTSWQLSKTPWKIHSRSPLLGEHNAKVFGELLGIDPATLEDLVASGAVEEVVVAG